MGFGLASSAFLSLRHAAHAGQQTATSCASGAQVLAYVALRFSETAIFGSAWA